MFDRGAESADSEPGFGPGGATFACERRAESYIVARRSRRASRPEKASRIGRRNHGARLQAFLTGTDESLFDHLKGRALGVRVSELGLTALEDV
jgi:hypothetical protein